MEFLLVTIGRILRKTWCIGPCAGVDYIFLILCPLQYMYHGHGRAILCRSRFYAPVRDLGFGLRENQIEFKVMSYLYFGVLHSMFM
jgi:hypothetical protein